MQSRYVLAVLLAGAQLAGAQVAGSGQNKGPETTGKLTTPSDIAITPKPGQEGGEAEMTVNGKVRKIAPACATHPHWMVEAFSTWDCSMGRA
jgi:hypothetical protein